MDLSEFKHIAAGDGELILATGLQGRIFAAMDGEILHRFDAELAAHPGTSFNNIGGNSLWPAPEGGPFAFNYPADGLPWRVQDGINCAVSELGADGASMVRRIVLENRKGVKALVTHRRRLTFPEYGFGLKYGLKSLVYASTDSLALDEPLPVDSFLMSAWSLEQFPLTPGAFAFGTMPPSLNTDFYGDPAPYLTRSGNGFCFRFIAPERLQIGIPETAHVGIIGACIPERDLVIVRRIVAADAGKRINFADNEQLNGVYSACDMYSVFYGASQNFFELETLAPVRVAHAMTNGSAMTSETHFYRGDLKSVKTLLANEFNLNMEEMK